jgi:Tfp pilus assembly protein PilF
LGLSRIRQEHGKERVSEGSPAAQHRTCPCGWNYVVLIGCVGALYARVASHDFVFDDIIHITENPMVRRGLTWHGLAWALTTMHAANWQPLTWLSHLLDCTLFGLRPAGHHLVNVAIHALNAALLFAVLRRSTGACWRAAAVALVFAVHPLRVESVAWVSERKDVLSGAFWMLTMLAYVRYARAPTAARFTAVLALLGAGLAAKPMLVTLPAVLLLWDAWPLGRWSGGRPSGARAAFASVSVELPRPPAPLCRSPRVLVVEKLPLLAVCALAAVVTLAAQRRGGAVQSLEALPVAARIDNAMRSYVTYLWMAVWPVDLAFLYPHPAGAGGGAIGLTTAGLAAGTTLLAVTVVAAALWSRLPYLLVGWLWYLGTLLPVIGIVQVGNQALADRYTYIPLIGIAIVAAWGAADLVRRRPRWRLFLGAAAAGLCAFWLVRTWEQIAVWRDEITLNAHALRVTANNVVAHNNLGRALYLQGRLREAAEHLERALALEPQFAEAHNNLGAVLLEEGRLDAAGERFARALEIDPAYAEAYDNLGLVRFRQGRLAEAAEHLEKAVALAPGYARGHYDLGTVRLNQGRPADAAAALEAALRLRPDHAEAHNNLGVALLELGQPKEAAARFEAALALKPDHATARAGLARARSQSGGAP